MTLDEILGRLGALPDKDRDEVKAAALEATKGRYFVPNIGPQTDAYLVKPTRCSTAAGRRRLGRSPGKGDAVVMCLAEGNAAQRKLLRGSRVEQSTANMGYSKLKKRR